VESSLQETLIEVSRQAFVENAEAVELGAERFPDQGNQPTSLSWIHSTEHFAQKVRLRIGSLH